jgi:hypothetical protein
MGQQHLSKCGQIRIMENFEIKKLKSTIAISYVFFQHFQHRIN